MSAPGQVDLPASMQALREAVDTACARMDRLCEEKQELVDAFEPLVLILAAERWDERRNEYAEAYEKARAIIDRMKEREPK